MPRSIPVALGIAQLFLALSLVAILALTGLLVPSTPARASLTERVHAVPVVAYEVSSALAPNALADGPQIWCGSSNGSCP